MNKQIKCKIVSMINVIIDKLTMLAGHKRSVALVTIAALAIPVFYAGVRLGQNQTEADSGVLSAQKETAPNQKSTSRESGLLIEDDSYAEASGANTPTPTATTAAPSTNTVNNTRPNNTPTPNVPVTTVVKSVTNADNTVTKEIVSTVPIPYASKSQNETNMKRGDTQVVAGQNGVRTVVYLVTYDKDGNELSRTTKSDAITKQPIEQITKIGISDFNLSSDTVDGTEFGEMCLAEEYGGAGDGCVGVPSNQHFSAISLSGVFYVSCISSTFGVCGNTSVNIQPVIRINGNTFTYSGSIYRADPRAGGGGSEPITGEICAHYGLACGSW